MRRYNVAMAPRITPARHQAPLPLEKLIVREPYATQGNDEKVEMDVVFVGGGAAGLAGAIHLARLVKAANEAGGGPGEVNIAVLEKAEALGQHNLSGAVIDPSALRRLFPEKKDADFPLRGVVEGERVHFTTRGGSWRIPTPPPMKNHGNFVASLSEVVRWLGEQAEGLGVNLFTGFPVDSLLVEGERVIGVRTAPTGLARDGSPGSGYQPPTDVTAKFTVLSEGTRGPLTQAWMSWAGVASKNPQIYALGVKELWEVKQPLDAVIHTLGWPLPRDVFGGSFCYPMGANLVSIGLVAGLDAPRTDLDVHALLQRMKLHPLFRPILEGGSLVEWGAKTIPEGGYYALPERRQGRGVAVVGDAAGFVDVAALKGIHHGMHSGIAAAAAIFRALVAKDVSPDALASYDAEMDASDTMKVLRRRRNLRLAFKSGFWFGGFKAALMTATRGAFPGWRIGTEEDAAEAKDVLAPEPFTPDGKLTFSKVDGVFRSGNKTRDDVPSHLIVGKDVPGDVADLYASLCPAGVYERSGDKLVVNAPNCVDCKATDVLGPRWSPREGGSGPKYQRM